MFKVYTDILSVSKQLVNGEKMHGKDIILRTAALWAMVAIIVPLNKDK